MLSIGIVGLPNVGKSTLFNALTSNNVLAANYPFATIEPNIGIVPIPDPRLEKLAEIYSTGASCLSGVQGAGEQRTEPYIQYGEGAAQPGTQQLTKSDSMVAGSASQQAGTARRPRIVPATVTFVDIAGLVAGASKGEGLGNQFLANIRSCNAIAHVVRAFDDPNVQHVDTEHNSQKDIDVINTELILADLQTVDRRLPRLEKESRANPKLRPLYDKLKAINNALNDGKPVHSVFKPEELEGLEDLQLLTMKPVIYVFNVDEEALANEARKKELLEMIAPSKGIFVCAKLEHELQGLDEADRQELLLSYGVESSGLDQLIHAAYDTLGLQSYLTAGEKEVRAWTIRKGSTAPQAAGVIHGDFERGFIAAQIIDYNDLISTGSEAAAKAAGKIRTEGKTYVMQPNDVVEFRFNVSK